MYTSMHTMKTAISVDDQLLHEADQAARQMGLSRSRLFSVALGEYLRHRRQDQMLDRLNQVYASEPTAAQRRKTAKLKAKFRSTIKDRW